MSPGSTAHARESGQAMVEFTLGALALFTILFALMTFGHTFGKQLDLQGANRDAARRAAVTWDNASAETVARQVLYDQLALTSDEDVSFNITPAPPWNHGDRITVRSSTPHDFNILGVTAWSGTLRTNTSIRVE